MELWQQLLLIFLGIYATVAFSYSYFQTKIKKNPYGLAYIFGPLGGLVFADLVIFGPFWLLTVILTLFLKDFLLFLLIGSVFWLVRSIGEAMYWFLQQFSTLNKNPVERFILHRIFKTDAVWFMHQIYWQCLTVIFVITTIYLTALWLNKVI